MLETGEALRERNVVATRLEELSRAISERWSSIACGGTFGVVLLVLPLLNYFLPDLMATRVGGFPLTWLILGVLFFPFVWVISYLFIRRSLTMG